MNHRICIFGNSGSGKTSLAKRLGEVLGIEVFHLDKELLRGNYEAVSETERVEIHNKIIAKDKWIIDGNYSKLILFDRIKRANLVIFLNVSRARVLPRILRRTKKDGQEKESIPEGANPKRLSIQYLKFVTGYNRKKYLSKISKLCAEEETKLLVLSPMSIDEMKDKILKILSL